MTTKRNAIQNNFDPSMVSSHTYNEAAGAIKVAQVGLKLKPLTGNTTDASGRIQVGRGKTIAVFPTAGVGVITVGDIAVANGAAGSVQAGTTFVRIPCTQNQYTYINTYDYDWIITDAATTLCFLVEDHTEVRVTA